MEKVNIVMSGNLLCMYDGLGYFEKSRSEKNTAHSVQPINIIATSNLKSTKWMSTDLIW